MPVSGRIVGRRAQHTLASQPLTDGRQSGSVEVLGEDPSHDWGSHRIWLELVLPLAKRRLAGVRVRSDVNESIPVRRSSAEKPAVEGGLSGHRAANTNVSMRFRSPFDIPPYRDMTRSCASLPGSTRPPTSGTHNSMP